MNLEARLACTLIEKWGLVVGLPDGEDSAGRAKIREATPEETVNKACDVAQLAVNKFRALGWMIPMPSMEDLDAVRNALSS